MGDNISIDWGNAQQAKSPFNAFMQGMATSRQMNLLKAEDQARQQALANPSDMDAITRLAVYNPQAAAPLQQQLVGQKSADVISSYGNAFAPQQVAPMAPPQVAPSGLPQAAPGTSFQDAFAPVAQGALSAPGQAPQGAAPAQGPQVPPQALLSPAAPHMQAIGAAAAQGQANPQQALAEMARVSSPQAVSSLVSSISQMDQVRVSRLNEANTALGTAAQTLLQAPQAQRAALLTQMAPYLAQHGITTEQVQQAIAQGLTDQQLHGFVGQAVGVSGLIEQANKERTFSQTDKQIAIQGQNANTSAGELAENIRYHKFEEGKGIVSGYDGSIVNPTTGQVIYRPSTGGDSLATRNNNPGNIRDGAFAQSLPGYIGSEGGFAKFDTVDHGQAAQTGLLQNYISRGFDTPAKIAARWAPAGDGNNPGQYAQALAQAAGIGVNDKVPAGKIAAMAQAQARLEGFGSGGGAGGLTGDAIDNAAQWAIQNGGKVPTGFARNKAAQAAIQNRIAVIAQQRGMSVPDMIAQGASTHADTASLATLQKQATTVMAAENAAQANAQLALSLAPAVGNGNIQVFNAWKNHWSTSTGDPAVAKFAAALNTFSNEYATVMGRGTPTDTLRAEAHTALNTAQSPQQLTGVIQTLQKDMANRRTGYEQERQATLARIGGHNPAVPSISTGKLVMGKDGVMEYHP